MRYLVLVPAFAFGLVVAAGGTQHELSGIRILFSPKNYIQPVYSSHPRPVPYLYFENDVIQLRISFANWGDRTVSLDTGDTTPGNAVFMRLFRLFRESGEETELPVRFRADSAVSLFGPADRFDATWKGLIELPARWHATTTGAILTERLEPGTYQLRLSKVNVACAPDCEMVNQGGSLLFEIRSASAIPSRLDRLVRQAIHAIDDEEDLEADAAIRGILELQPDASIAYQLLGRRAERQEQWGEAAVAYEQAAQLIEGGRDRLRPLEDRSQLLEWLRDGATRAKARGRE